jgi:DME family drug/metabolite transporter
MSSPKSPAAAHPGVVAARAAIVAAALLWSTSGLFAKSTIFASIPLETRGTVLAFYRALFAGLLVFPLVRRPRWNVRLVPMALAFTAMNVAFLQSMTITTAANAIWLQSTAPLWVFLIGLAWQRALPATRDLFPLVAGVLGVSVILAFELSAVTLASRSAIGVLLGLFSGVGYACVIIALRSLRGENGAWLVVVNHLTAAALLAPYCIWLRESISGVQLAVLAAFGLLQMGLPYVLFARGLRVVGSQEAAGITLIEPVLNPVWVWLAWGERPAPWTVVGGALILCGLVLRYVRLGESPES